MVFLSSCSRNTHERVQVFALRWWGGYPATHPKRQGRIVKLSKFFFILAPCKSQFEKVLTSGLNADPPNTTGSGDPFSMDCKYEKPVHPIPSHPIPHPSLKSKTITLSFISSPISTSFPTKLLKSFNTPFRYTLIIHQHVNDHGLPLSQSRRLPSTL